MPLIVWQDQGIDRFREIASRLASVLQSSSDTANALAHFTESIGSGELFADLMIEYSSRWFQETGGQSILIGPELFWLLSEPGPRRGTGGGIRGPETHLDSEYSAAQRARKLLLLCVLEALAQNQWLPESFGEPALTTNGMH